MKTIKRGNIYKGAKWIARNADGSLYVYERKPVRKFGYWESRTSGGFDFINREESRFANIKWSDDEPTKIED